MDIQHFVGPWRFFSSLILYKFSSILGRGFSPLQDRYVHTGQHKPNIHTPDTHASSGIEPTTPMFEQATTVNASDRAAIVFGNSS
jgi:hypothetical protein